MVMQEKRIHYLCEGRLDKSIPRDHRLSSLDKPHDANQRSSDRFFYSTRTLMMNFKMLLLFGSKYISNISLKLRKSDLVVCKQKLTGQPAQSDQRL